MQAVDCDAAEENLSFGFAGKEEFEYKEKAFVVALVGFLIVSSFSCKKWHPRLFQFKLVYKKQSDTICWGNTASTNRNEWLQLKTIKATFAIFDYQDSDAKKNLGSQNMAIIAFVVAYFEGPSCLYWVRKRWMKSQWSKTLEWKSKSFVLIVARTFRNCTSIWEVEENCPLKNSKQSIVVNKTAMTPRQFKIRFANRYVIRSLCVLGNFWKGRNSRIESYSFVSFEFKNLTEDDNYRCLISFFNFVCVINCQKLQKKAISTWDLQPCNLTGAIFAI